MPVVTEAALAKYGMSPLRSILRRNKCVMSGAFLYSPDVIDILAPMTQAVSTVDEIMDKFKVPGNDFGMKPSTCIGTHTLHAQLKVRLNHQQPILVNVHAYDILQTSVTEIIERSYPILRQHWYYDGERNHMLALEAPESGSILLANTPDLLSMCSGRIMRYIDHFALVLEFGLGRGCWDALCALLVHHIRRNSRLVVEGSSMSISGWWKENMRAWSHLATRLHQRQQYVPFVYLTLEYPGTDCLRDLRFFFSPQPPDNAESVGRVSRCCVPERSQLWRFAWSQNTHDLTSDGSSQSGKVLSYDEDLHIHYTAAAPYPPARRNEVKSLLPEIVYDYIEQRDVPRDTYLSEDKDSIVICVPDQTGRLHATGIPAKSINSFTRYLPCVRDKEWAVPDNIVESMHTMELVVFLLQAGSRFVPSKQVHQALEEGRRIWVLRDSRYRWDRAQNVDRNDIESGSGTAHRRDGFPIDFLYFGSV